MISKIKFAGKMLLIRGYSVFILLFLAITMSYGQAANRKALFVIDIQENLVNSNSKIHMDTSGIGLFFTNLNNTITHFNNNGDLVIYIINEWTNPFMNWGTGNVCKKGAKGVGLDKRLSIINDKVYSKSQPNALSNKDLFKYIKDNKITDVYVMGLLAEGCVKATVNGLIKENFNAVVIEDALGSKNNKNKSKVLNYLQENKIRTIKSKEI